MELSHWHSGAPGTGTGERWLHVSNMTAYQAPLSNPCCLRGQAAARALSINQGLHDFQVIPTAVQPVQLPGARLPPCTSLGSVLSLFPQPVPSLSLSAVPPPWMKGGQPADWTWVRFFKAKISLNSSLSIIHQLNWIISCRKKICSVYALRVQEANY